MINRAVPLFFVGLCLSTSAAESSRFEYDKLNRLTKVTYDNGYSISYTYDAVGNIKTVTAEGRCSATLQGRIEDDGDSDSDSDGRFQFNGMQGEPVTLRLEAIPREAGVGKFGRLKLLNKKVLSALPTELTAVLPRSGGFVVRVKDVDDDSDSDSDGGNPYVGDYHLTLEASPGACASFNRRSGG